MLTKNSSGHVFKNKTVDEVAEEYNRQVDLLNSNTHPPLNPEIFDEYLERLSLNAASFKVLCEASHKFSDGRAFELDKRYKSAMGITEIISDVVLSESTTTTHIARFFIFGYEFEEEFPTYEQVKRFEEKIKGLQLGRITDGIFSSISMDDLCSVYFSILGYNLSCSSFLNEDEAENFMFQLKKYEVKK